MMLLNKGIMCRGYITRGNIYHTEKHLIGSGYQRAYFNEAGVSAFKREANERGTPFVEIDDVVSTYIEECRDSCVKDMFSRLVKRDCEAVALFPFQALSHSLGGNGFSKFDAEEERRANHNVRLMLRRLRKNVMAHVDTSNPSAVRKAEHYIDAIDAQFLVCNETDEFIDSLTSQIGVSGFEEP